MTSLPVVPEAQIILYAKGSFLRGDLHEDLRILVGDYTAIIPRMVSGRDIVLVMYSIYCMYIPEPRRRREMEGLLLNLYANFVEAKVTSFDELVRPILAALADIRIKRDGEILVNLGEPNFALLPKNE